MNHTVYAGSNIVPDSSTIAFTEEGLTSCSQALIPTSPAVLIFIIHLRRHELPKDINYLNLTNLNLEVQFIPSLKALGILEHVI